MPNSQECSVEAAPGSGEDAREPEHLDAVGGDQMSGRPKFNTRDILLHTQAQKELSIAVLQNAPLDDDRPLQFLLREKPKGRKPDQNQAMWSGPLFDIAEQAWVDGKQFRAETWHEHFKRKYLPEDDDPDIAELAREGYRKWDITPTGERVLVGSTTQLLVHGMAVYMQQIEAEGAGMGVHFHVAPGKA